jgi:Na+/proline symporter
MMLGPRVFLVFMWLLTNWYAAFDSRLVALLGWLLLPYTSLAWMYIFFNNAGQIQGGYVILLILAVLLDIGVFSGGHRAVRERRLTGK